MGVVYVTGISLLLAMSDRDNCAPNTVYRLTVTYFSSSIVSQTNE